MTDIRSIYLKSPARRAGRWLILCVTVGLMAGTGAVIFHFLCNWGHFFFLEWLAGYRPSYPAGDPPLFHHSSHEFRKWVLWIVPAAGGLLSGILVALFCPEAQGHGTDSAIETYHNKNGLISAEVPFVKTIASFLTLGSGGSGGSEGPICQIGAGLGSILAQVMKVPPREMRILMAAGLGAGIGSIFRAPLTGALFASEILYRDPEFEADVIIPTAIASTIAYSLFCSVYGWGSMFKAGDYRFTNVMALGPYAVLAICLAAGVFLFVKTFWGFHDFFQKKVNLPIWFKPAVGGLATGTIGLFLPQVLGFSYGFVQDGLYGKISVWLFVAVAVGKILATTFSIGSGGSGGVFGPSVVIGGSIGGAVGMFFHNLVPNIVPSAGPFIIVGMAGFLAGNSNIPITAVIVVSEITSSYHLLLPSMMVCSLSYFLSRRWNLYRAQVNSKIDSPVHKGDFFNDILEGIKVKDIFNPNRVFAVIPEDMTFAQFCKFFSATDQHYFPVVDRRGRLSGIFSINDIRHCLFDEELGPLVIARDIARKDVITTTPSEDINTLLKKFTIRNIDRIPVVADDDPTRFSGMISRREVIDFYNKSLNKLKDSRENTVQIPF